MYDPVLNRPMFQAQNTAAPEAAPMGAKGTGITSMVTSPDPETTAQQLKYFANPAMPTVGYADGGPVTQEDAWRPTGLGKMGQAMGLIDRPTGLGPVDMGGQTARIAPMEQMAPPRPDAMAQFQNQRRLADEAAGRIGGSVGMPTGGGDSYDIFKSGIAPVQGSSGSMGSSPAISGKGVIIQTYANGGPVQHFEEGGLANMWGRFTEALRVGGGEANMSPPDVTPQDAEYQQSRERIIQQRAEKAAAENAELFRRTQEEEARLANEPPGYGGITSLPPARPESRPAVSNFQNPYGATPPSDSEERRYIEERAMPKAPPLPPERPPVEDRTSIKTELSKIKEDRKAQSAADRRENALMALMSAGFGMAAGKSRHALTNIAEGGQQGIGTFAQLEKGRREDEHRRYLADLHERELLMNEPYKKAMTEQAIQHAEYLKSRPESDRQRQQLRETTAMYAARKEAAQEFIRRKKDDFNFAQQFNNPALGPAMEKEWLIRRTRELMPEHLAREMNNANNVSQGNVSQANAE